jgi:hypothetical protein
MDEDEDEGGEKKSYKANFIMDCFVVITTINALHS